MSGAYTPFLHCQKCIDSGYRQLMRRPWRDVSVHAFMVYNRVVEWHQQQQEYMWRDYLRNTAWVRKDKT